MDTTQRDIEVDGQILRLCSKCGERKGLGEFGRSERLDLGKNYKCYPCNRESVRKSRAEKREREDLLAYELTHEVKWCSYGEHMVPWSGFASEKRSRHGLQGMCNACMSDYHRADYAANPEKHQERNAKWKKANPEKVRAKEQRYRSQKKAQYLEDYDTAELFARYGTACAYCGVSLVQDERGSFHVDHITPLVLGGLHAPHNLALSCADCNLSKNGSEPNEWLQRTGKQPHPLITVTLARAQERPEEYVKTSEDYRVPGLYGSFRGSVMALVYGEAAQGHQYSHTASQQS